MVHLGICVALAIASSLESGIRADATRADLEARAVYQTVIEHLLQDPNVLLQPPGRRRVRPAHLLIDTMTRNGLPSGGRPDRIVTDLRAMLDGAGASDDKIGHAIRVSYVEANLTSHPVPRDLTLSVPYAVEEFKSPANGWWQFYRDHPASAGAVLLSGVGFNETFTQALVFLQRVYGDNGGTGDFYLLTRDDRGWHVQKVLSYSIA